MPQWALVALAALFLLVGGPILAWALLGDRARGRRRCPKCWYSLDAVAGLRCPECGRQARRERQLLKTRRRWRPAALGLALLLIAGGLALAPEVLRHGWAGAVPSALLVRVTRVEGLVSESPDPADGGWARVVQDELSRRALLGELTPRHLRVLLQRMMRADPQERERLLPTRKVWPVGYTVRAVPQVPFIMLGYTVVVEARAGSGPWARCQPKSDGGTTLLVLGKPSQTGDLDLEVRLLIQPQGRPAREPVQVWSGLCRRIRVVASHEEVMTAVHSEKEAQQIHQDLIPEVERLPSEMVRISWPTLRGDLNLTFALAFEIYSGELVLARGSLLRSGRGPLWAGRGYVTDDHPWTGAIPLVWDDSALERLTPSSPALRVRVRGDPELALADFGSEGYWAGEFTMPTTPARTSPRH
jgi:hypothetical protein